MGIGGDWGGRDEEHVLRHQPRLQVWREAVEGLAHLGSHSTLPRRPLSWLGTMRRMSVFHSRDLFEIAWLGDCDLSPDGRHVALTVTHLDRDADAYRSAIWLVEVATGRCRQFTAGTDRDSAPRWSPDGRWLAFLTKRPGEQEKPQLAVMPTDGGESRVITAHGHGAGAPVWAPDSRRLAFSARTGTPPDPSSKTARPYRRITELKSRLNGEGWTYDTRRHLFVVDQIGRAHV